MSRSPLRPLLGCAIALYLLLGVTAESAHAQLQPQQVLVLYDSRIPDSFEVAEYYAGSQKVQGGPIGNAPGVRPNVRTLDLAVLGGPALVNTDMSVQMYLDLRTQLRGYLRGQRLEFEVRCLVLTKGLPHRILDFDDPQDDLKADRNPQPLGDSASFAFDERVTGDASFASLDSELTLLWKNTLDSERGQPGDSPADGAIQNPYYGRTEPFSSFPNDGLLEQRSFSSVEGFFSTQDGPQSGPTNRRFGVRDLVLVSRLDGPTVESTIAAINRAQNAIYDPRAQAIVLDESSSEGVQDLNGTDGEIDNSPSRLGVSDDYEAARDALLADGRFLPSLIRYNALSGRPEFLIGPLTGNTEATDEQIVQEPIVLLASYGANHGGGQPGGIFTARTLSDSFIYADGAIFNTLESFNGRGFGGLGTKANQEQAVDFIAAGGTFAVANAYEPLADTVADNEWIVRNFILGGMTWVEAAWTALPAVSWVQVVVGDPLATAEIRISPTSCSPADLAEPFGVLDDLDVEAGWLHLLSGDAAADFDGNGLINALDLTAFLAIFDEGCQP
ncbi:MAG: hypothetical protein AAGJ54_07125 [Planctomycetota bacterium]